MINRTKPRDYAAEYRRRIARGLERGLNRSEARGHRSTRKPVTSDERLELALKQLRKTGKLKDATREARVSPERFRRFLKDQDLVERKGRAWVFRDGRPREFTTYTMRGERTLTVIGFDAASLIGRYNAAVKSFLETNDADRLAPFVGLGVTDAQGRRHVFETDPNALYRAAASGSDAFNQIYRIIV
jgi:hypothetical protein